MSTDNTRRRHDMVVKFIAARGERVLEIGAGSGYAAAVLSEIAGEVYTVGVNWGHSSILKSLIFYPGGDQELRY